VTRIEEKYQDLLIHTAGLCATDRFELILYLFDQFEDIDVRNAVVAGLVDYVAFERDDLILGDVYVR
jgi:hypothetical protein